MEQHTEKRYYYPAIEELHVGFECEVGQEETVQIDRKEYWEKAIIQEKQEDIEFGCLSIMVAQGKQLEKNVFDDHSAYKIRIKHLDKDDFESLGWKQSGLTKELFIKKGYFQLFGETLKNVYVNFNHGITQIFYLYFDEEGRVKENLTTYIFRGVLKNKSELKKIMQQLNIQ